MKLDKPFNQSPDFEHLRKVLMRESTNGFVPMLELTVDAEIMSEATGIPLPGKDIISFLDTDLGTDADALEKGAKLMDLTNAFFQTIGYDYVISYTVAPIQRTPVELKGNFKQDGKLRGWQNEHKGIIMTREDFQNYPWPSIDKVSTISNEYIAAIMPPGRKTLAFVFGIFEDLRNLMGFEEMAVKSIEEPDLVDEILEQLTILAEVAIDRAAAHPSTGAIFYAEDMGFNTSTMLSPAWMREHVIPKHKRLADACHKHGKPFLLHSCGQIDALMDDLIEVVGIDARHSFQDNIEPVEEVYKKYGDRIAILGGVDVDLLARGTEEQVRTRTRQILEVCAPGGGFCIGSGNSVTNFCKIENYYAMLDETRKWNETH